MSENWNKMQSINDEWLVSKNDSDYLPQGCTNTCVERKYLTLTGGQTDQVTVASIWKKANKIHVGYF